MLWFQTLGTRLTVSVTFYSSVFSSLAFRRICRCHASLPWKLHLLQRQLASAPCWTAWQTNRRSGRAQCRSSAGTSTIVTPCWTSPAPESLLPNGCASVSGGLAPTTWMELFVNLVLSPLSKYQRHLVMYALAILTALLKSYMKLVFWFSVLFLTRFWQIVELMVRLKKVWIQDPHAGDSKKPWCGIIITSTQCRDHWRDWLEWMNHSDAGSLGHLLQIPYKF